MKKHIPWKTVQYSSLLLQVLMVFPIASVSFLFVSKVNQSIGFGKKTKSLPFMIPITFPTTHSRFSLLFFLSFVVFSFFFLLLKPFLCD